MKKHKVLIGLSIVGLLLLLYWLYKRGAGSASTDAGAGLPGVIVTGGGASYAPTMGTNPPIQTYDNIMNAAQPQSFAQTQPSTSASGVPNYTAQAQEFNVGNPVAVPHPDNSQPSFYGAGVDATQPLQYQQLNPQYVSEPGFPGGQTPTLESFLQQDVRAYEVSAQFGSATPGQTGPTSAPDLSQILGGEASGYCASHPEACQGVNQQQLISGLTNTYSDFLTQQQQQQSAQQSSSQPGNLPGGGTYVNPTGVAPVGTPIQVSPGVWLTPNQIAAQNPTAPATTTPTTSPTSFPRTRVNPYIQ